ncbi:MAG: DNRLRE domain-containing protein [Calditrichaeota bacterium]|nr:DNRLRE domain-containing protein [Calditrichota bacterium]
MKANITITIGDFYKNLFIFLLVFAMISPCFSGTAIINATHDSFVDIDDPDENNGDWLETWVGRHQGNMNAWYRFDIPEFVRRGNPQIENAELRLYQRQYGRDFDDDEEITVYIHPARGSWDENEITWNDHPAFFVNPVAQTTEVAREARFSWWTWGGNDFAEVVQSWISNPNTNYGFVMLSSFYSIPDAGYKWVSFGSHELYQNGDEDEQYPRLVITGDEVPDYPVDPIQPPSNLVVVGSGANIVQVEWNDNSDNEEGFSIFWHPEGEGWSADSIVAGENAETRGILGLVEGTHYKFKIHAYNDGSVSDWSNESNWTYPGRPDAPDNFNYNYNDEEVIYTWNDRSHSEEGFEIEERQPGSDWELVSTPIRDHESITLRNHPLPENTRARIRAVNSNGLSTSGWVELVLAVPMTDNSNILLKFEIKKIYPNPFNSSTTIPFSIPYRSRIDISIYDISGKNIQTILQSELNAGFHDVAWNGGGFNSGLYIVRLTTKDVTLTSKLLYIQ